jgi:hypothetical protein
LAGKIESLLPLVHLKHEKEFVWGMAQKEAFERIKEYIYSPQVLEAFERIKEYIYSPQVLQAPKMGRPFRMYIAAKDKVIGAVLTQEGGKEFVVAYASMRLSDAETKYTHVKKICLTLYYACSKFRHYILSSSCIVTSQHDVVKYMMQKPILSGRVGKMGILFGRV